MFREAYSWTIYLVSMPSSSTDRYHLTMDNSDSSCSTFALSVLFFSIKFGSLLFSISSYYLFTSNCMLKSAIENWSSFWILKRRCSLILGLKQSYSSSYVRSSIAYSASITGPFKARSFSSWAIVASTFSACYSFSCVRFLNSINCSITLWCCFVNNFVTCCVCSLIKVQAWSKTKGLISLTLRSKAT